MNPDESRKEEIKKAFFSQSTSYAGMLRNWLVAYGVGGPALLLTQAELTRAVARSGHVRLIAVMFFSGVLLQVLNAFMNKWSSYYGMEVWADSDLLDKQPYRFANWWNRATWTDITVDAISVVLLAAATLQVLLAVPLVSDAATPTPSMVVVAPSAHGSATVAIPAAFFPNARASKPPYGDATSLDRRALEFLENTTREVARCTTSDSGPRPTLITKGFASDAPFLERGVVRPDSDQLNLDVANLRASVAHEALMAIVTRLGLTDRLRLVAPAKWSTLQEMRAQRASFDWRAANQPLQGALGRFVLLELSDLGGCARLSLNVG